MVFIKLNTVFNLYLCYFWCMLNIKVHSYSNLVSVLKTVIQEGLVRAQNAYEKERVLTYWRIGKAISKHLLDQDNRARYGEGLYGRLSEDLDVGARLLYEITQFYNTYPEFEHTSNLK